MFVVRSMEPMCPVIAFGKTPEEAWAACDAAGVARDRAIVERSPATSLGDALAAVDDAKQIRPEMDSVIEENSLLLDESRDSFNTIADLREKLATSDADAIAQMINDLRGTMETSMRRAERAIDAVRLTKVEA